MKMSLWWSKYHVKITFLNSNPGICCTIFSSYRCLHITLNVKLSRDSAVPLFQKWIVVLTKVFQNEFQAPDGGTLAEASSDSLWCLFPTNTALKVKNRPVHGWALLLLIEGVQLLHCCCILLTIRLTENISEVRGCLTLLWRFQNIRHCLVSVTTPLVVYSCCLLLLFWHSSLYFLITLHHGKTQNCPDFYNNMTIQYWIHSEQFCGLYPSWNFAFIGAFPLLPAEGASGKRFTNPGLCLLDKKKKPDISTVKLKRFSSIWTHKI